jgi:TP901 family phage tail tape measure protein
MADRTIQVRLQAITDRYQRDMRQAGAATAQTGTHMHGATRATSGLMTAVRRLVPVLGVAGLVRGFRQSFNAAVEFESTVAKLRSQIGLTTEESNQLADASRRIGVQTGLGAQQVVEASYFIASAGLRGADAMDALEASAQAARVGLGDQATVADLVTSAMNAYGSNVLGASDATDVLIGAVREGKAEASELAGSMGAVLPIASEMGVSFDQVGAAMAAMTRTGTNSATAATQLRAIMVSLLKPAKQSADTMAEFGLSAEGLRRTIQEEGLWAALVQVKDAVGDNEEAMAKIFPNVRALAGVLDLTGANAAETEAIFARMADTTGLLSDAVSEVEQTTEDKMNRIKAHFSNARIAIGEEAAGISEPLMDIVLAASDTSASLRDLEMSSADQALLAIAAAAGKLGIDFGLTDKAAAKLNDEMEQQERIAYLTGAATEWTAEQYRAYRGLADDAASSTDGFTDSLEDVEGQSGDTRTELEKLVDVFNAVIGVNMSAERANLSLLDGWVDLTEALKENGSTLDENTQKGRDNRAAIMDQADAILDAVRADYERDGSLDAVARKYDEQVGKLRDVMRQAGLTEDQIDSYIDTLGLTPDQVVTAIVAETGAAESALLRVAGIIGAIPRFTHTTVTVGVDSSAYNRAMGRINTGDPIHTGGFIQPGGSIKRYHQGGQVKRFHYGGMTRSDEVPAILQTGELVMSRRQVELAQQAFANLPGGVNPSAGGGRSSGGMSIGQVTVNMPPGSNGDDVVRALKQYERTNGPVPVRTR